MRSLEERARRVREQAVIRSWQYRQREHANGVWYRLRRLLVDAEQLWIIDEAEADRLEVEGRTPCPVGGELSPRKRIFRVTQEELATIAGRRRIAVRLNAEFLDAHSVVLVPYKDLTPSVAEA